VITEDTNISLNSTGISVLKEIKRMTDLQKSKSKGWI